MPSHAYLYGYCAPCSLRVLFAAFSLRLHHSGPAPLARLCCWLARSAAVGFVVRSVFVCCLLAFVCRLCTYAFRPKGLRNSPEVATRRIDIFLKPTFYTEIKELLAFDCTAIRKLKPGGLVDVHIANATTAERIKFL